jgi:hypothetical protein
MKPAREEESLPPRSSAPMLGRRVGSTDEPQLQSDEADPIIEHPHLPAMGEQESGQRLVRGQVVLMNEHTTPAPSGGRGEMASLTNSGARSAHTPEPGQELPPQQPAPSAARSTAGGGYLRLQLQVEDGDIALVGVSRVDGPLGPPEPVQGGLAYEVTLGERQLGAGAVPDPGVRRAFPPPDEPAKGHIVVAVPSFEFTARIPADQVSAVSLEDIQIGVYRMDSGQVVSTASEQPLHRQAGHLMEEVATLRGIHAEQLPHELRARLDDAVR